MIAQWYTDNASLIKKLRYTKNPEDFLIYMRLMDYKNKGHEWHELGSVIDYLNRITDDYVNPRRPYRG